MQIRKKCELCNTLNNNNQIYCVNCGKYLRGKILQPDNKLTIWGVDASPVKTMPLDNRKQMAGRNVVVCPECQTKSVVKDGVLPLSCVRCGYFFQAGIDRIINEADISVCHTAKNSKAAGKTSAVVQTRAAGSQVGPLKRAASDTSSMRLISLTSTSLLPEVMKEVGNIIGKNGTVFRNFISEAQISIWHTSSGWYARATMGTSLYNGVPMNQGVQIKLTAGDLLVMDQEQFMVEIV